MRVGFYFFFVRWIYPIIYYLRDFKLYQLGNQAVFIKGHTEFYITWNVCKTVPWPCRCLADRLNPSQLIFTSYSVLHYFKPMRFKLLHCWTMLILYYIPMFARIVATRSRRQMAGRISFNAFISFKQNYHIIWKCVLIYIVKYFKWWKRSIDNYK